ncbi:MAG: family 20 glycosylhydrolase, partial [Muribaculaceae bacterium]|nr:family 20 glycosylhydrolase [Muribaculaceae bacterium]
FHWHLSDDQGWRIEIGKYPLLTEVGSVRKGTCIGHDFESSDSIPYGGFYTQDEAREIVRYAADRHITVIPEIDLPGHMLAALTAYPELGCTGGPYDLWQRWGVSEELLCAGNDSTYTFIAGVLNEIMDVFPSEYVHVGGDECPKERWEACARCQSAIKRLGLKSDAHSSAEEKLQSHVMAFAGDVLARRGRKMLGWDEMLDGGLPDGAAVMSWRGVEGGIAAARAGHDAVMTPVSHCYFDYYQAADRTGEPEAIGGYIPLEKVYSFEPVPDVFTAEEGARIKGVQANLWTEYIPTMGQVFYMELPRLAALSEVQWRDAGKRDFADFSRRLPQLMKQYDAWGYDYARHLFDVQASLRSDAERRCIVAEFSTIDDAPVHYTLDGSEPTEKSPRYTGPVELSKTSVIKAAAVRGSVVGRVFTDSVSFNKATACAVTLADEPHSNYTAQGAATLTDGRFGQQAFNTGGWLGFQGTDLVATIDLGEVTEVSSVVANALVDTSSWIFDATGMKVETSTDGNRFVEAASASFPAPESDMRAITPHRLGFPAVEARYVRVTMGSLKKLPSWHGGAGRPAFLFVDEIVVE